MTATELPVSMDGSSRASITSQQKHLTHQCHSPGKKIAFICPKNSLRLTDATGANGHSAEPSFVEGLGQSMRALEVVIRELSQERSSRTAAGGTGSGEASDGGADSPVVAASRGTIPVGAVRGSIGRHAFSERSQRTVSRGHRVLGGNCRSQCGMPGRLLNVLPAANGNGGPSKTEARLICGSARDLEAEVKADRFREDLYYRISGVCLRLPPLRQRKEDIPCLMSFFLAKYAQDFRRAVPQVERADPTSVSGLFLAGKHPGAGGCGQSDRGVGRRVGRDGRIAVVVDEFGPRRQRGADFLEAGLAGGFAGSGEGIDSESPQPHALEPAAGCARVADQLQGPALQVETDWIRGIMERHKCSRRGYEED